jgi:hypothetical protein
MAYSLMLKETGMTHVKPLFLLLNDSITPKNAELNDK